MISQTLREARKYEEIEEKKISEAERPAFHLTPRVGWMNDPNGFAFYRGKFHIFYQYHPYDSNWGPMHWGHAVSTDLLHWEYLPAALAPDTASDEIGCFSGSSCTMDDGSQLLLYTGVHKKANESGESIDVQEQCIAVGDGNDYVKYEKNPIIRGEMLPEGSSRLDFRDPKIWRETDGTYACVVGNCTPDKDGQLLIYTSKNGLDWEYSHMLEKNNGRYGKMWECPDYFTMDGKSVVIMSPQEMLPVELEFHNGNETLCQIGHLNEDKGFVEENRQAVDYGIDFYAPQTTQAPDGRRILIAWMQNWDTCPHNGKEVKWFGQLTLPREVQIKEGRLITNPVRELLNYRKNKVEYENVMIDGELTLEGIKGRCADIELTLEAGDMSKLYQKFAMRFAQQGDTYSSVSYRPHESVVKMDRKFSGIRRATIHQRRCRVYDDKKNGSIKMRIILDRLSAEVFINDGVNAMSLTINTPPEMEGISFFSDGKVKMNIVKYDLI